MEKQVLMICDAQSFMVNAICDNLKSAGFEVKNVMPNVNDISRIETKPELFLMYLGEYVDHISETLVYLKDLCLEEEKKLFLIGNDAEFKTVYASIPDNIVGGTFNRPLNVKFMVERLNEIVEQADEREKRKSILVVDDDGTMLRTIKTWLSESYNVTMANSGMNAITYLAKNKPDLILLDYEMPVCSGPQVLEMIRMEPSTSNIPVMFLTAKGDRESVLKVLQLKPEGYLLKTMQPDQIITAINKFFEEQKSKQKLL